MIYQLMARSINGGLTTEAQGVLKLSFLIVKKLYLMAPQRSSITFTFYLVKAFKARSRIKVSIGGCLFIVRD
jgi:hypothetical protein